MSQVNLLPHDVLQGQRYRRLTLTVLAGGAVVLAVVVAIFLLQMGKLGSVNDDITDAEKNNAALQSQINDLQKYEDLQVQAQQAQAELTAAYAGQVSFSGMLMDISRVIPNDAFLTTYSSTITGAPAQSGGTTTGGTTTTTPLIGTMSMGGEAIGFDSLSEWLTRLEMVQGWVNPWMPTIAADSSVPNAYTFTTSVDLTQEAETPCGQGQVDTCG
jgi:Tfp pilus assembly protein PilN